MTATMKRTMNGTVDYGKQKEYCRKAAKSSRRFEKKKLSECERKKTQAARKRSQVLEIRKMIYDQKAHLGTVVKYWMEQGWEELDVLNVVFYRTWKSLLPKEYED